MIDRVMILGVIASFGGLILVLELVRRRKLREDYSLLWLATALVLIVLSLSRPLLDQVAALLGVVTYPPAALFVVAIVFVLFILLQFSTSLTRLSMENKRIAQEMALLRWELIEAQRRLKALASLTPSQEEQSLRGEQPDQQHG